MSKFIKSQFFDASDFGMRASATDAAVILLFDRFADIFCTCDIIYIYTLYGYGNATSFNYGRIAEMFKRQLTLRRPGENK